MTSPYPISDAFKAEAKKMRSPGVREVGASMGRMLKEYEHGTANIEDVAIGLTLKTAAAVLMEGLLHLDGDWS